MHRRNTTGYARYLVTHIHIINHRVEAHNVDNTKLVHAQANERFSEFATVIPIVCPSPKLPLLGDFAALDEGDKIKTRCADLAIELTNIQKCNLLMTFTSPSDCIK